MKVTILGSCRQQSILKYIEGTSIQEGLNYPHYTKEILQQIMYLKTRNISNNETRYCFRDGLLSFCQRFVNDEKYQTMKNEFETTDIFLVEIASRISYEWNELYLHHIAEEPYYQFPFRNELIKRDLTDDEIEQDIINIRDELYPKKLIVISHFSTYKYGKRYELINLLEQICLRLNIPFLNQSDIIEKYGINILVQEHVLSHYTQEGNEIVGKLLFEKINNI